ncbi:MAG: glycosyltransferase family 9 protein [Candidatus Omnitrophota bacterium]
MIQPKRILIVRTDRIGDVVLSTPVIKNIRLAYPESYIAFLCRPYTKDILVGNPYLDEVIVYDKYHKDKGILVSLRFIFKLRKKRFDWAVILHPTKRVNLMTFLAAIPLRIGWDKDMGFLLSIKLPHTKNKGEKHELEYNLDLLRKLKVPVLSKDMFFPLKKAETDFIDKILAAKGIFHDDLLIIIHSGASCLSKRWPPGYFIELIDFLKKRCNPKIAVISGSDQDGASEMILKERPYICDLRGFLTLSQLGSLLKRADILISNDSGPVHISAAVNRPVISIFGRADPGLSPRRWKPLGEKSAYCHKDVACKICLAHRCLKGYICLTSIKPEEILVLAEKLLRKR